MHPIIVCLCLLCMTPCCSLLESYQKLDENTADCVIDVTDMLDYDPVSKTSARCERMRREREQAALKCDETKRLLDECTRRLEGDELNIDLKPPPVPDPFSEVTSCHELCSAEDMFFLHLVKVLQVEATDEGPVEAELQVRLTRHNWQKLQKFVKSKDYRKADIHDVLVGMNISVFHTNQTGIIEWIHEQVNLISPGVFLFIISFVVLVMVFGVGMYSDLLWNGRFLTCVILVIAIFLISYLWNWIYHYQALTFTLSAMFVDRMKYMGRAVSEFHAEIFRDLPLWEVLPVLIMCYVLCVHVLAVYLYIAALRRVRREAPDNDRPHRVHDGQHHIDNNEVGRQQPIEGHQHQQIEDNNNQGIRRGDAEDLEEGRVENAKEADDHRAEVKQVRDKEQNAGGMAAAEASGTSPTAPQGPKQVGDASTGAPIHHPASEYDSRTVDSMPVEGEPEASLSPTDKPSSLSSNAERPRDV